MVIFNHMLGVLTMTQTRSLRYSNRDDVSLASHKLGRRKGRTSQTRQKRVFDSGVGKRVQFGNIRDLDPRLAFLRNSNAETSRGCLRFSCLRLTIMAPPEIGLTVDCWVSPSSKFACCHAGRCLYRCSNILHAGSMQHYKEVVVSNNSISHHTRSLSLSEMNCSTQDAKLS